MSRASTILPILAALALVLVGAWWIGAPSAVEEWAAPEVVPDEPDEPWSELELADDGPAGAEAAERVERVAIAESPSALQMATTTVPSRAGAVVVRGTLIDSVSGEPLREYVFGLSDPSEDSLQSTDAEGRFESADALLPGPLSANFFEADARDVDVGELRLDEDGRAVPLLLRVASGPTYRLALEPRDAPDLAQFRARLQLRGVEGESRISRSKTGPAGATWVRFAPIPREAQPEGELVLESNDGLWRGAAKVRVGVGTQPGVVRVQLTSLAALEVDVRGPDGERLVGAVVRWNRAGSDRALEQVTRRDRGAVFERIVGEPGTLTVRLARYLDVDMPLVLRVGERRVETVTLVRAGNAGSIRGLVSSDSGRYEARLSFRLTPRDEGQGARSLDAKVAWSAGSGSFRFDDLPPGKWRLSVVEDDWYEWEPRAVDVVAPLDGVHFRVHDSVPVCDLRFDPLDETGARVATSYEVRVASGPEVRHFRGNGQPTVVAAFPVDRAMRWRVDAPGCATAFGDWSTLSPLESIGGREQRGARPLLAKGWAQLYRVVRSDNRKPLANALALVDGREAGRTDAQGRIVLRADSRPEKVLFRWRDWRMVDRVDLAPLRAGSREFERTLRMSAPKNPGKK